MGTMVELPYIESPAKEKHYTPAELAKMLGLCTKTVAKMLESEPGVLRIGHRGLRRTRITLRVPESVWQRIHEKYCQK